MASGHQVFDYEEFLKNAQTCKEKTNAIMDEINEFNNDVAAIREKIVALNAKYVETVKRVAADPTAYNIDTLLVDSNALKKQFTKLEDEQQALLDKHDELPQLDGKFLVEVEQIAMSISVHPKGKMLLLLVKETQVQFDRLVEIQKTTESTLASLEAEIDSCHGCFTSMVDLYKKLIKVPASHKSDEQKKSAQQSAIEEKEAAQSAVVAPAKKAAVKAGPMTKGQSKNKAPAPVPQAAPKVAAVPEQPKAAPASVYGSSAVKFQAPSKAPVAAAEEKPVKKKGFLSSLLSKRGS